MGSGVGRFLASIVEWNLSFGAKVPPLKGETNNYTIYLNDS